MTLRVELPVAKLTLVAIAPNDRPLRTWAERKSRSGRWRDSPPFPYLIASRFLGKSRTACA